MAVGSLWIRILTKITPFPKVRVSVRECAQNSTVNENLSIVQLGYLTPDLILRSIQLKIYKIIIDDDNDGDGDDYSIIIIIKFIALYTALELPWTAAHDNKRDCQASERCYF